MTVYILIGRLLTNKPTRQRPLVVSLIISQHLTAYLTQLLYDLESVEEPLPHHPEENALLHSLQAFEIAQSCSNSPTLIAAALLHDVGKSQAIPGHAALGAEMLQGFVPDDVVWLVEHHMDLLYDAKRTKRLLRNTQALDNLKMLRQWDLQARVVNARVCSVEFAVTYICHDLNEGGDTNNMNL